MNSGTVLSLKVGGLIAVAAVAVVAGYFCIAEGRKLFRGDVHNQVWFYDESEKKLYPMPVETMPPDKGIGGPSGDGEKAVVVTFGSDRHDRNKWRIAYLQKYTPSLKKTLDEMILARAAHRIFDGSVPSRQSEYFQSNTLVKRPDEHDWHAANSDEGKKILGEWRSWRGSDGSGPVICPVE